MSLAIQYFNIALLCYFLFRVLRKPVGNFLAERIESIKDSIDSALTKREEAKVFRLEFERLSQNSEQERKEILDRTQRLASERSEFLIKAAGKEAEGLKQKAEEEIRAEREKASDDIKKQVIELSAFIAERIVRASIDQQTQQKYLNEAIADWSEQKWQV